MKTATLILLGVLGTASIVSAGKPKHHKGKYKPKSHHHWGPPGKKPGKPTWPSKPPGKPPGGKPLVTSVRNTHSKNTVSY